MEKYISPSKSFRIGKIHEILFHIYYLEKINLDI